MAIPSGKNGNGSDIWNHFMGTPSEFLPGIVKKKIKISTQHLTVLVMGAITLLVNR